MWRCNVSVHQTLDPHIALSRIVYKLHSWLQNWLSNSQQLNSRGICWFFTADIGGEQGNKFEQGTPNYISLFTSVDDLYQFLCNKTKQNKTIQITESRKLLRSRRGINYLKFLADTSIIRKL